MDTLSNSFHIPSFNPKSYGYGFHHFKNNNHLPQQSHLIPSSTKPRNSKLPNKASTFITPPPKNSINNPPFLINPSQSADFSSKQSSKPPWFHRNPSTGYAVALLDIGRSYNSPQEMDRDTARLFKWFSDGQVSDVITYHFVGKREKGEIVREIVHKGNFHKHLVRLVNLLAEKAKVDMVNDILSEFGRIYDELRGCNNNNDHNTQVVLVPCGVKMQENEVLRIAKRVQKIRGAKKVKVRQLVHQRLPSFVV